MCDQVMPLAVKDFGSIHGRMISEPACPAFFLGAAAHGNYLLCACVNTYQRVPHGAPTTGYRPVPQYARYDGPEGVATDNSCPGPYVHTAPVPVARTRRPEGATVTDRDDP
jgi:hypothetical protein